MTTPLPNYQEIVDALIEEPTPVDELNDVELAKYLSDNGIALVSVMRSADAMKKKLEGMLALKIARKERLHKKDSIVVPFVYPSVDEIRSALEEKFGGMQNVPIAARNFKTLSETEWKTLYQDFILEEQEE